MKKDENRGWRKAKKNEFRIQKNKKDEKDTTISYFWFSAEFGHQKSKNIELFQIGTVVGLNISVKSGPDSSKREEFVKKKKKACIPIIKKRNLDLIMYF